MNTGRSCWLFMASRALFFAAMVWVAAGCGDRRTRVWQAHPPERSAPPRKEKKKRKRSFEPVRLVKTVSRSGLVGFQMAAAGQIIPVDDILLAYSGQERVALGGKPRYIRMDDERKSEVALDLGDSKPDAAWKMLDNCFKPVGTVIWRNASQPTNEVIRELEKLSTPRLMLSLPGYRGRTLVLPGKVRGKLAGLSLVGFEKSKQLLGSISELDGLEFLKLRAKGKEGEKGRIDDEDLRFMRSMKNLVWIDLSDTMVGDKGLEQLAGLESLEGLDLSGTRVTDNGLGHLAALKSLRTLNLSRTAIKGKTLGLLSSLPFLEGLDLSYTGVGDDEARALSTMDGLRVLRLKGTRITSRAVALLARLARLTCLDLDGTRVVFGEPEGGKGGSGAGGSMGEGMLDKRLLRAIIRARKLMTSPFPADAVLLTLDEKGRGDFWSTRMELVQRFARKLVFGRLKKSVKRCFEETDVVRTLAMRLSSGGRMMDFMLLINSAASKRLVTCIKTASGKSNPLPSALSDAGITGFCIGGKGEKGRGSKTLLVLDKCTVVLATGAFSGDLIDLLMLRKKAYSDLPWYSKVAGSVSEGLLMAALGSQDALRGHSFAKTVGEVGWHYAGVEEKEEKPGGWKLGLRIAMGTKEKTKDPGRVHGLLLGSMRVLLHIFSGEKRLIQDLFRAIPASRVRTDGNLIRGSVALSNGLMWKLKEAASRAICMGVAAFGQKRSLCSALWQTGYEEKLKWNAETRIRFADLNRDGRRDLAVAWNCGTSGCDYHIYLDRGDHAGYVGEVTTVGRIKVLGSASNGLSDLYGRCRFGCNEWSETYYRFDGKIYRVARTRSCRYKTGRKGRYKCDPWGRK